MDQIIGEFEIHDLFQVREGLAALTGRLISGGPISNENDIQKKEIFVVFFHEGQEIRRKIIKLDGVFIKFFLDLGIEVGDNAALVIPSGPETEKMQTTRPFNILPAKIVLKEA
ncbi:hypothetical protein D3C87_85100 [compost metagenome]